MTRRLRLALGCAALAGVAALLLWGVAGLPGFGDERGPYGTTLNRVAQPERHTTNVVAAIVFDYRALDTLGEELMLMTAVVGLTLLLRASGRSEERDRPEDEVAAAALNVGGRAAAGIVVLVGLWLVAFGYVTPGGGFQGGVIVAGGLLLLYLLVGQRVFARFTSEDLLDPLEAAGGGGYIVVGMAALVSGLPFLHNLLGHGTTGTLWSGGSIAILNWAVALEVAAANTVIFSEFIDEYVVPLARGQA